VAVSALHFLTFGLSAALQLAAFHAIGAQQPRPTAAEVVARISEQSGVGLPESTVDTFKAGNPDTRVTGIAVTMMATLDVLQRAAAKGHNLIITHEPTFYGHRDAIDLLEKESDAVYAAKQAFIKEHQLIIWRFHDTPHSMKPDMIRTGMIRALGWEQYQNANSPDVFDVAPTTVDALAKSVSRKLGANAVRTVGDPKARVSRVGLTLGFPGFGRNRSVLQTPGIEALIMGEDHEWETIEYAADAITAKRMKGVIVLGHVPSEQAGMEEVARWLGTFIKDVPIEMVRTADPFKLLSR